MNKFIKVLESYWRIWAILGASSLLVGILYQYSALEYNELSFFSWTQAINDSIKIIPIIVIIFLWGYLWLYFLLKITSIKFYKKYPKLLGIIFGVNLLVIFWLLYLVKNPFKWLNDNLIWTIFIWINTFFTTLLLVISFYWYLIITKIIKQPFDKWLKNKWWISITIVSLFVVWMSIFYVKYIMTSLNDSNCLLYNGIYSQIRYLNDKYVFVKVFINSDHTDSWTYYTKVIPNENLQFLSKVKCDNFAEAFTRYIKKDESCLKVLGYDKDYKYIETGVGLIDNNWYDLYLSWACIGDKKN